MDAKLYASFGRVAPIAAVVLLNGAAHGMGTSMRRIALAFVVLAGCAAARYETVEPISFTAPTPRAITFDVLAREAAAMGYIIAYADPLSGTFHVHSRAMGRPPRRPRAINAPPRGVVRSNIFVVEVSDRGVRVSAIGRNVRPDGAMHPTLARELEIFGGAMRDRASSIAGTYSAMPAPPPNYGAPPPGYGPVAQPQPMPGQAPPPQWQQPAQPPPAQPPAQQPPPPQQDAAGRSLSPP